ncbi:MAG: type IV secretory system conjugative DNA transfer family protein [Candidatus Dormibacteraceae bacterium]
MTASRPVLLLLALAALVTVLLISRLRPPGSLPDSHGGGRWASRRDRGRLGRSAPAARLHPDGLLLGFWGRRALQTPREDNLLLLGVQRSGKTSAVVVPSLLAWRGALIATSTKEELVSLTGRHRSRLGPVHIFAPLDDDLAWVQKLGLEVATWNPVGEASTAAVAAEIADLFTAEGKAGYSAHWYLAAASLISALLLFEQSRGGDLRSVLALLNRTQLKGYRGLAGRFPNSAAAELLIAFANTPEKEAGSIASTARACLTLWMDERVERATTATAPSMDLDRLLAAGGSLYLVAPTEEAERCRPLFSALLQSLLRRATARARRQGGVLKPRLLLALDEVANFARIPRLAAYVSTGPGQGLQFLLCFHDLAQLEHGYGEQGARTIWNNCRARLLLPGQGDLGTLERFSKAIGDTTRVYQSRGRSAGGDSQAEQRTGRPLASPDALRRLETAVLLYASQPPAQLRPRRWDQVPAWRALVQASGPPSAPARLAEE